MSRTFQVTFDAHDPRALSTFWRDALGYVHPRPARGRAARRAPTRWRRGTTFLAQIGVPEDQRNSRSAIEDPDGSGPRVFFQQVPEDKVAKNRVHLDVRAAPGPRGRRPDGRARGRVRPARGAGAPATAGSSRSPPMEAGFIVMADPEGNEFCLD